MTTGDQARQHITAALNGDLAAVNRDAEPYRQRAPSTVLPLRHTPATEVASVLVDGGTLDPDAYTFTPFALVRVDGGTWPTTTIRVTYTTGWEEGEEPLEIIAAIEAVKARLEARPDTNLQSEAADDIRRVYAETGAVTSVEIDLIRRWRQP